MLRWFANIKLVSKLAVPLSLLVVITVAMLWTAQSGIAELRNATGVVIEETSARRALDLTVMGKLSEATVMEKNILLETGDAGKRAYHERYKASFAAALKDAEQLIALADSPGQRAANELLRDDILEYRRATDKSIALGLKNDREAAFEVSKTEGAPARKKVMTYIYDRVQLLGAEMDKAKNDLNDLSDRVVRHLFTFAGVGLAVSLSLLAAVVVTLIVRPLAATTRSMQRLAGGDLTVEVQGANRKDEVGMLAQSLQVFKDNGIRAVALEAEAAALRDAADAERSRNEAERAREGAENQAAITALARGLDALANGDLTHEVTESVAPRTQQLKDDLNATALRLRETMTTIAAAIEGMTAGTGEFSQAADDLSRRTEQQAASLEQTAAALDEITATVRNTAEGATQAQNVVSAAKDDAEQSSVVMRDAVLAMSEIEKSSQEISQILGVIDEIAFQTNLLALNAGVEAARAGDAGRGFAVVASEVRTLAKRSAEAAKEIKQLIATSSRQVDRGVKLVGETGQSLQRIVGQVTQVHTAVSGIAASAKEQATALREVNTAINQMDQVTQQNAAMVEQSTAASHSLMLETSELSRLTSFFQIGAGSKEPAPVATPRPVRIAKPPVLKIVAKTRSHQVSPSSAPAVAEGWTEF